ncbi:MAG TPA: peptidylprolyl isomerase [Methanotrichaceae archaeon]|nr:peptidylprolyl isomerase [Methanotrichaceae archaeon]
MKPGSIISLLAGHGRMALIAAIVLLVILSGCLSRQQSESNPNAPAKPSDTVLVNYTARLDNGTVIDTTAGRGPIEFTIGNGEVIVGLEDAVVGMVPGETKNATIPADEAYGPYQQDLVIKLNRSQIPPEVVPKVGEVLPLRNREGVAINARVINATSTTVTLDANNPLAGKNLNYEIKLVAIVKRN